MEIIIRDGLQSRQDARSVTNNSEQCYSTGPKQLQTVFPIRPTGQDVYPRPACHSPNDWNSRKHELRQLYLTENNTLRKTREIMKQRGFDAR
jgi:hypothetical protein